MEMEKSDQGKIYKRSMSAGLIIALGFFILIIEVFIMYILEFKVALSPVTNIFIDALVLTTTVTPVLFFLYREFKRRSQIELELQKERDKFKAIFEEAGDGIWIIDTDFNILNANPKMAELTGIPVAEQIGKKCYECLGSKDCGTPACTLKRILAGNTIIAEEKSRLTRRGEVWMQHSAAPLKGEDGQIIAIVEIFRDISQRKQMEEALREAEERYRIVIENSPSGIFVLQDGVLKFVNQQFARIFGYPQKELLGTEVEKLIHPEDRPRFKQFVDKILKTGEITQRIELRGLKAGEEEIILGITSVRIDYQGRPAVLGHMADITRRKQTEKELRETNQKLQRALDELKRMQARLVHQEKLISIGQLAAGIAHEINNPVGFVFSNFRNLRDYVKDFKTLLEEYRQLLKNLEETKQMDEEALKRIKEIEQELDVNFMLEDIEDLFKDTKEGLKRVTEIIQKLREFSRVDQVGEYTEYNINEGIKSTLVITRNEYKDHVEVKTELGNIPPIYCHPGQINEVLMNLILNAVQAIKSQNRTDKGTIFIKTYSDDNYVYCVIKDDGPGIPEEIKDKIFDPFFTTKEVGKGTGLGLSICYDIIVNKHKGDIWVESEPGKGSTFFIKLPIKKLISDEEK